VRFEFSLILKIEEIFTLLVGPKNIFKMELPQRMDLDGNFNFQLPIQSLLAILT